MKILVSASACNPVTGSEAHFGWMTITALSREHEVHVLLHELNRAHISQAAMDSLPGVTFHFSGSLIHWHPNRMLARLQNWRAFSRWQKSLLAQAKKLHQQHSFNLSHHATIASWRLASPLWKLGIPLIHGPVGGAEHFPAPFMRELSPASRVYEYVRQASNLVSRFSPSLRECLRESSTLIASNSDTETYLRNMTGRKDIVLLSNAFFTAKHLARFRSGLDTKEYSGPLRIFAGGDLEGRKGVALALQALAHLKKQGIPFSYTIGGHGAELEHLQKLAARLHLDGKEVIFRPSLPPNAYLEQLKSSHVYLLPSLRENAGLTLMESMLAGLVPIVADGGGPGNIVTPESGFKIAPLNPEQMIAKMAEHLLALNQDRPLCREMGKMASSRILLSYSENAYLEKINAIYSLAVP